MGFGLKQAPAMQNQSPAKGGLTEGMKVMLAVGLIP